MHRLPSPARRHRARPERREDVAERLDAVACRLEEQTERLAALGAACSAAELGILRAGLAGLQDIDELISRTRVEVAGLTPEVEAASRLAVASDELEAVVNSTEQAAVQIMAAAEQAQDAAARIRALPTLPDDALRELDAIDAASTDTFMACSFQDLTGQRIRKVVQALTHVEGRVKSLIELWSHVALPPGAPVAPIPPPDARPDAHLMNGPTADGLVQDDVDSLFAAPSLAPSLTPSLASGMATAGLATAGLATTVASQTDIDNLFN